MSKTLCVVVGDGREGGMGTEERVRVPDQKGVSLLYIMLEIHHSGREPLKFILIAEVEGVPLIIHQRQTIARRVQRYRPKQSLI